MAHNKKAKRAADRDDIRKALMASVRSDRDKILLGILIETGCTSSELAELQTKHWNSRSHTLILAANTHKQRTLKITKELNNSIKQYADPGIKYLFCTDRSEKISTRTIRKILDQYSEVIGTKITTSSLRKMRIKASLDKDSEHICEEMGLSRFDNRPIIKKHDFELMRKHAQTRRDKLILDVLYETGCLLRELKTLKACDIDVKEQSITVGHPRQRRTIPISVRLNKSLQKCISRLDGQDNIFSTRQSEEISDKRVFQIVKQCARDAGLDTNPRTLRNTYISNSFISSKSLHEVTNKTGIKNIGLFHLYGSLELKKEAVSAI